MNSAEDRNRASALTRLLRAELRDACFSVTHLTYGHIEFVSGAYGGHTSSTPEESSIEELDAHGLQGPAPGRHLEARKCSGPISG